MHRYLEIHKSSNIFNNILLFDKKKSLEILHPLKGCTYLEMIKRQDIPESLTIESPKNSANLLAVLIEVDFWAPYSAKDLDIVLFSEINSHNSESGIFPPEIE